MGILTHLTHGFMGPAKESTLQSNLNQFNHFCRAHKHDQPTQTDLLLHL